MSRYGLLEKYINKQGRGLEIGPSHSPLAPKRAGYRVDILDHTDRAGLLEKYHDGVNRDNIEEVDFVWRGEKYSALTGHVKYYDWVIASHVIEHTPDLIAFINDCFEIVHDHGVIVLAVPDATHCFDYFRQITSISTIIDAHLHGNTTHSIGTAVDHLLNVCTMNRAIAWDSASTGDFALMHPLSAAKSALEHNPNSGDYADYHAWCFTPHSFRLLIEDLYTLGLTAVREVAFIPTGGFEFFMVLGGQGAGPKQSRLAMMKKMKREIAQKTSLLERLYFGCLRLKNRLAKYA